VNDSNQQFELVIEALDAWASRVERRELRRRRLGRCVEVVASLLLAGVVACIAWWVWLPQLPRTPH